MIKRNCGFEVNRGDGVLSLTLHGEIDHHSAVQIRTAIDELLYEEHPKKLVLDLSQIEFMDSSGLGLIMGRYTLLDSFGGETVLLNPTDRIRRILDLAGFGRICKVEIVKKNRKDGEKNAES